LTNHATAYISLGGNSNPPVLQAGPTFTYTLDAVERPVSLTSNQAAGILAQNVVYNAADQITQMDQASALVRRRSKRILRLIAKGDGMAMILRSSPRFG